MKWIAHYANEITPIIMTEPPIELYRCVRQNIPELRICSFTLYYSYALNKYVIVYDNDPECVRAKDDYCIKTFSFDNIHDILEYGGHRTIQINSMAKKCNPAITQHTFNMLDDEKTYYEFLTVLTHLMLYGPSSMPMLK